MGPRVASRFRAASTPADSPPSRSRHALSRSVGTGDRAAARAAQRPARPAARRACALSAPAPRAAPTRGPPASQGSCEGSRHALCSLRGHFREFGKGEMHRTTQGGLSLAAVPRGAARPTARPYSARYRAPLQLALPRAPTARPYSAPLQLVLLHGGLGPARAMLAEGAAAARRALLGLGLGLGLELLEGRVLARVS